MGVAKESSPQTDAYPPIRLTVSTIAEKPAAAPFEVEFLYSVRDPGPGASGTRRADDILFLNRIASAFRSTPTPEKEEDAAADVKGLKGRVRLFLTPGSSEEGACEVGGKREAGADEDFIVCEYGDDAAGDAGKALQPQQQHLRFERRRITIDDVGDAAGASDSDRRFAVVYICGVPDMTDGLVDGLTDSGGRWHMERHRVLCEKWW